MRDPSHTIRAAIVGAGLMGRWHAHALTRVGGQLIAVVDVDDRAARRLGRSYGADAYPSLDGLLSRTEVDVLHICTPLATHAELARRGLEAGAHVLVEKPLTPDAASTKQLLDCARAHGRLIMPVHQFLFQCGIRRAFAHLPTITPLVHFDYMAASAGAANGSDWSRDELLADIVPHSLALLQRFLPGGLDAVEWQVAHPAPGELRALGHQQGISLSITLSTRGRPTHNSFTIIGGRGSIYADLFHGFAVFESGQVSRARKILQPFMSSARVLTTAAVNLATRAWRNETAYPGLRELIRAFYDAIRRGTDAPITKQEILAVACARDRLVADAHIGNEA